ncbi:MAG: preprotein translocase subunit SecY [Candidatus Pacebacteria bacterium RIFOXYB1_FULL_44_10]|nr:MAG: preprotein translocase subunit SecY [Candidatus Pacebacteria bacterium RIFOXYB1_FULL_44_10]
MEFLQRIWDSRDTRKRVLFTASILFLIRLFGHLPVPGIRIDQLRVLFEQSPLLGMIDLFSGGTLANFSVMAIGINPYITASIIIQMATFVFPKLKEISKEGESGREQINQYTRFLTVPIAVIQSISVLFLLNSQSLVETQNPLNIISMVMTMVAGSMIMVWLGELITQKGLGNGISMIIFAGIVGRYPISLIQSLKVTQFEQLTPLFTIIGLGAVVVSSMVIMNEAIRKVSIHYATRVRGSQSFGTQATHLPLKLNQTGVLPIIFAVSMMMLPSFLGKFLQQVQNVQIQEFAQWLELSFQPNTSLYAIVYFALVVAFSYFSTAVFFNPKEIADDLKKSGAFVPGVRPGKHTETYLGNLVTHLTLPGAIFLGVIAVLPTFVQSATNISTLTVGGTGLLIVVSVVLETVKQIKSSLLVQDYDKFR